MSLSTLPPCYCTNVHSWRSLSELLEGLEATTSRVAHLFAQPLSVGLWFSDSLSRELDTDPAAIERLNETLSRKSLTCHTLNAFPHGDFHEERVKRGVYIPDWSNRDRFEYTLRCAKLLSRLLPDGREGSISTLPLGSIETPVPEDFMRICLENLIELARGLDNLHSDTGRLIRLAIEPEPFCHLETTPQTIQFFEQLRAVADAEGVRSLVEDHIGVCFDVCHQAIEFEDLATSIQQLSEANIRINKVQISSALEIVDPGSNEAARMALAEFVEPRYLHQVFARHGDRIHRQSDLTTDLCQNPPEDFRLAECWRVHFHVPVHYQQMGLLGTTSSLIPEALAAIATLEYAPHLEVETYTWSVLPGDARAPLEEGLAKELAALQQFLTPFSASTSQTS